VEKKMKIRKKKKKKNKKTFRRIQSTVSTKLMPTLEQFERPQIALTTGQTITQGNT
jgi:hypothetical protein